MFKATESGEGILFPSLNVMVYFICVYVSTWEGQSHFHWERIFNSLTENWQTPFKNLLAAFGHGAMGMWPRCSRPPASVLTPTCKLLCFFQPVHSQPCLPPVGQLHWDGGVGVDAGGKGWGRGWDLRETPGVHTLLPALPDAPELWTSVFFH